MASTQPKVTVVVAPRPGFLSRTWPPDNEAELSFLARHYPSEWSNLLAALQQEYGASERFCKQLSALALDQVPEPRLREVVEGFLLFRAPTYARTVFCVSKLLDILAKDRALARKHEMAVGMTGNYVLFRLHCPQSEDPTVRRYLNQVRSKGVALVEYEGERFPRGLTEGDYHWVIPAGAGFIPYPSATSLALAISQMTTNSGVDVVFDGSYSCVLRASCAGRLGSDPTVTDVRGFVSFLQQHGMHIVATHDDTGSLCEIESIYGGSSQFQQPKTQSLWSRLFSR